MDSPKQLSFLEAAVLPFVSKLPASDVLDILEDVKRKSANVDTDEDPNGWRPYYTFVNQLREKYTKNEVLPGSTAGIPSGDYFLRPPKQKAESCTRILWASYFLSL